jgi:hypothetical protein
MLVMKIGMEQYDQLAEKAVMQLRALLAKEDSPLTAQQLIQLTTICLYCVHSSSIKGWLRCFLEAEATSSSPTIVNFRSENTISVE